MYKKYNKKGFTLIEILVAVVIGAVLLTLVTGKYILGSAKINSDYKNILDVQTGVKTSMDMVVNTLKDSDQIYLVGKNVYDPKTKSENLKGNLDDRYNYIAFQDDGKNRQLVNIVSKGKGKGFDVYPISASDDKDSFKNAKIFYNFLLYKDEDTAECEKKLQDKLLNITIEGKSELKDKNDVRKYQLSRDIYLKNVAHLALSEYFVGNIKDIKTDVTAIAYRTQEFATVVDKGNSGAKAGVVLAVSDSMYMDANIDKIDVNNLRSKPYTYYRLSQLGKMGEYVGDKNNNIFYRGMAEKEYHLYFAGFNNPPFAELNPKSVDNLKAKVERYRSNISPWEHTDLYYYEPTRRFKGLTVGEVVANGDDSKRYRFGPCIDAFVESLYNMVEQSSGDLGTALYMFRYASKPEFNELSHTGDYLYPLKNLKYKYFDFSEGITDEEKANGYENKFQVAEAYIKNNLNLGNDFAGNGELGNYSNVGEGLLQQIEILKQMSEDKSIQKRYLIIVVDGFPSGYLYNGGNQEDFISCMGDFKKNEGYHRAGEDAASLVSDNNDYIKRSLKYISDVINKNIKDEDKGKVFDKAYIIGYEKKPFIIKNYIDNIDEFEDKDDKEKKDEEKYTISNYIKHELINKANSPDDVFAVNSSDTQKLKEIFQNINVAIKNDLKAYKGPNKISDVQKGE